ncbi:MAG: DUF6152 family protein [Steroidobacteraceae bacterium]
MSMRATLALLAIAFFAGGAPAAFAHHSGAQYDFTKNVWVAGVVKTVRVINPHMTVTLIVSGPGGHTRAVHFEGDSVNNFYRAGWRPHMLRVGDKIKVRYNPRKDGREGGFVNGFVTASGRKVAFQLPQLQAAKSALGAAVQKAP